MKYVLESKCTHLSVYRGEAFYLLEKGVSFYIKKKADFYHLFIDKEKKDMLSEYHRLPYNEQKRIWERAKQVNFKIEEMLRK